MSTVNMEFVNFFQPPAPKIPKEPFLRSSVPPDCGYEDDGERPTVDRSLRRSLTVTATTRPSTSVNARRRSDQQVGNGRALRNDETEREPASRARSGGSGNTYGNPIAIDDNGGGETDPIFGDVDNVELDAKLHSPIDGVVPGIYEVMNLPDALNQGEPESASSSTAHVLPLSPDSTPAASLEAEQLNPDSVAENTRMTSKLSCPSRISNDDLASVGDESVTKCFEEARRTSEAGEETTSARTPNSPSDLTERSPLQPDEERHSGQELEEEQLCVTGEANGSDQQGKKRPARDGVQETADDSRRSDSGNRSDNAHRRAENDASNDGHDDDPMPAMKLRKKSARRTSNALTPSSEHQLGRRLRGRPHGLTESSNRSRARRAAHVSVESRTPPSPVYNGPMGSQQTARSADATHNPIAVAAYREWSSPGLVKCTTIGDETIVNIEFTLAPRSICLGWKTLSSPATAIPQALADFESPSVAERIQPKSGKKWMPWEDEMVCRMKRDGYSWAEIHKQLSHRTVGTIQARYSSKLKDKQYS